MKNGILLCYPTLPPSSVSWSNHFSCSFCNLLLHFQVICIYCYFQIYNFQILSVDSILWLMTDQDKPGHGGITEPTHQTSSLLFSTFFKCRYLSFSAPVLLPLPYSYDFQTSILSCTGSLISGFDVLFFLYFHVYILWQLPEKGYIRSTRFRQSYVSEYFFIPLLCLIENWCGYRIFEDKNNFH